MTTTLQSHPPFPGVPTSYPFGVNKVALEGRWEGSLGKGTLLLELRADGTASINMKRRVRTVYHPCTWKLTDDRIQLVCTRNQSVTFPILSLSGDVMVLRMGLDSMDACELHRTEIS